MANKIELKVDGMMCGHCVATVKNGIEALGCENVLVDLKSGIASADAPEALSADAIIAAIKKMGFETQAK